MDTTRLAGGILAATLALAAAAPAAGAQPGNLPILFETERTGNFDIYAMDPGGRVQQPVVAGPANDQDPDWSPSGDRFAFTSDRDGSWQIYVADVGGQPTRLTQGPGSNVDAVWSPDGSQIAFETNRDGNWEIYVMDADGGSPHDVSDGPENDFDPTWQPDGESVAFARSAGGRADIFQAGAGGGGEAEPMLVSAPPEFEPAISPDGDQLAFSRLTGRNYDLYVMDLRDGATRRLTSSRTLDEDPAWSPDGQSIVYTSERTDGDLEISVIPSSGGVPRTLTKPAHRADMEADWGPGVPELARAVAADHGVAGFPCNPFPSASTGTSGGFRLADGANGADRLCGASKRDWVRGRNGRDHLAGGPNRDRLEGGAGGDWLYAKDGEADQLWGGTRAGIDNSALDWAHLDKSRDVRHGIDDYAP
jgi:dipeptidyl aminopeptidase/acylaminoacyl peptidase